MYATPTTMIMMVINVNSAEMLIPVLILVLKDPLMTNLMFLSLSLESSLKSLKIGHGRKSFVQLKPCSIVSIRSHFNFAVSAIGERTLRLRDTTD